MKLSILLPILAAGQKKRLKKKEGDRSVGERFVASDVNEWCVHQVPHLGGSFQATSSTGTERSGEIQLDNYPDDANCKHVVQAYPECTEIQINFRSVAVEGYHNCLFDSLRLGWVGNNGFQVTQPQCYCVGDGCDSLLVNGYTYNYNDYSNNYEFYEDELTKFGPDSLLVDANSFTFFFQSDMNISEGHVILEWECVSEAATTTTDYETTTATTTTTTTTTTTR